MAADVFVSYARKDREQVFSWVRPLQCAGLALWIDQASIDGARLWAQEITEAIDHCKAVLLMVSPASVASKQVAREVSLASEANKTILPLLLEPTTIGSRTLRYHLAGVQHVELFQPDREATLRAIFRALARAGVTPGEPVETEQVTAVPSSSVAAGTVLDRFPSVPLTTFIGREREIAQIEALLTKHALLTLTGPGGTGKTRLARHVATDLIDAFADGALFVPLESINDPDLVVSSIAGALDLKESRDRPLAESLKEKVRDKELLLLLDNFEQVLPAAPLVVELLSAAPRLKVMVTSRARLHVSGEQEFVVPPLALPDPKRLPPAEALAQVPAVELFLQRAANAQPDFTLTEANAGAVAAICCRLDGLPLAIELAAARIKLLPPQMLLARLSSRLMLLTGGARDLPRRQQTLRSAIAWSHDLLGEEVKTLFRRLATFMGGCTLEAAAAVCNADGALEIDVLDGIASLVNISLVRTGMGTEEEARFGMLETVREYAVECLASSGEREAMRCRHAQFYLELAEAAAPELTGRSQAVWLDRLEGEHDNVRAALEWCLERPDAEIGLRLAGALARFWWLRGHMTEGRERLDRLLALPTAQCRRIGTPGDAPVSTDALDAGERPIAVARARALLGAGLLAWSQGDYAAARAHYAECLDLQRALEDRFGIAQALHSLAMVVQEQGDYAAARTLYAESLAIKRELGNRTTMVNTLSNLGFLHFQEGDYAAARTLYEECLTIRRAMSDKWGIAMTLETLGQVSNEQSDYRRARALHEECLALRRELGDRPGVAASLDALGNLANLRGEYEAARDLHEVSLATRRELGDKPGIATSLSSLANLFQAEGEYERARALREESLSLFRELGTPARIAVSLAGLGNLLYAQGDHEQARALHEEALAEWRRLGRKHALAWFLNNLGRVLHAQSEDAAASALYEESLAVARELGNRLRTGDALEGLAAVARAQGRLERAARLFGAVDAMREDLGVSRSSDMRPGWEEELAALRARMGEEAFGAAWESGRAMTPDQACDFAAAVTDA